MSNEKIRADRAAVKHKADDTLQQMSLWEKACCCSITVMRYHRIFLLLAGTCLSIAVAHAGDIYSSGGWATLHRDAGNRKLAAGAPLLPSYRSWHALGGATVLTAPTMSPDGSTLYVTTGRERGHSNLHAFSLSGELLWQAQPWESADDSVDACAVLSSPIVDDQGDIYVNDCNQLFAFRADGRVKWVTPLPAPRPGDGVATGELAVNAFTTAVFTNQGHVLGVTNFGDVLVLDRATGRILNPAWRLPGRLSSVAEVEPMPERLFSNGMIDPAIREWAWQLLFGAHMRSANTPAVAVETDGRVFVAATSVNEGLGALYALDLHQRGQGVEVTLGFATDMGPGSGSSPALSLSANRVYVSDETGLFYAIDAQTGAVIWQVQTRAAAAAAAVGDDGTVYALQANAPALVAIAADGNIAWQSDLSELAAGSLPSSWILGDPVAVGNGNPTVIGEHVLVPVVYGYELWLGRRVPVFVRSSLVAVDARTGKGVRNVLALKDDSAGITVILQDGTIINSLGGLSSSALSQLAPYVNLLLPQGYRVIEPLGGIQVSLPAGGGE